MGSQRVGHDVVTEQQKQVSTQLFKSKKGKPSCRFLLSSICFLWKVCHLCPFERSCLDGRSSLLYPKGTQWGGSTVGREHSGAGAPWRVLCGEDAPWGGSLVEREPCGGCSVGRELRGEGAPWGGCSMGRELGGGGSSVGEGPRWGGYSEEEEARQLLTPLPLGARQSKEGQKAAGLGVRQAGVWIPAQQLEPVWTGSPAAPQLCWEN